MHLFAPSGSSSVHTLETTATAGRAACRSTPEEREAIQRARAEQRQDRQATEYYRAKGYDLAGYDLPPSSPAEESFRHSAWFGARGKLRAALARCGTPAKALEAWDCCGSAAYVLRHKESGAVRVAANYCHHRLCLPCQRARSRLIGGNVRRALTGRYYLHVVLTLKHTDAPLAKQITRIYQSFKRLRNKPVWKRHCNGGAAFLEVTRNVPARQWHVHLHVIAESRFIPHGYYPENRRPDAKPLPGLSATWLQVTGDSSVVWIKAITDRGAAAAEVSKYVTKPLAPGLFDDTDALDEFVIAIKGRRLCLTFGTFFRIKLSERPQKYDPAEWEQVCKLDDLIARAEGGEQHANHLLKILGEVLPCGPQGPPPSERLFPLAANPPAPSAAWI